MKENQMNHPSDACTVTPGREAPRKALGIPNVIAPGRPSPSRTRPVAVAVADKTTGGHLLELDASDPDLASITRKAWEMLERTNEPPVLFLSGDRPVRIQFTADGTARLVPIDKNVLLYHLAQSAPWTKRKRYDNGIIETRVRPPMQVVSNMLAAPTIPLPPLTRIVACPTFGADGTLRTEPGYCAKTQTYYAPQNGFLVPRVDQDPQAEDIEEARRLILDELLVDFPFTGPAERAHAVSLFLLPYVRDLIDGPTPLHSVEAPEAGTGKGLLIDAVTYPATGASIGAMTAPRTEDEWRKRITSSLLSVPEYVFIDNLIHHLDSAALASATTQPRWSDRILGRSEQISVPIRCIWIISGNNPTLTQEIARRTVRIRLDARREMPWERTGFGHPNLPEWVRGKRSDLVWSALVLIQAWIAAGRPEGKRTIGSYEEWARIMGGILAFHEIEEFLGNTAELYDASNAEAAANWELVQAWYEAFGDQPVGVAELYPIVEKLDTFDLREGNEKSRRTSLGNHLHKLRGRHFGEYRVEDLGKATAGNKKNAHVYRLVKRKTPDLAPEKGNPGNLGNLSGPELPFVSSANEEMSVSGSPGSLGSPEMDVSLRDQNGMAAAATAAPDVCR